MATREKTVYHTAFMPKKILIYSLTLIERKKKTLGLGDTSALTCIRQFLTLHKPVPLHLVPDVRMRHDTTHKPSSSCPMLLYYTTLTSRTNKEKSKTKTTLIVRNQSRLRD